MIISNKQIMQLMTIARTYAENLNITDNMMMKVQSIPIIQLLSNINNQQSDELQDYKDE